MIRTKKSIILYFKHRPIRDMVQDKLHQLKDVALPPEPSFEHEAKEKIQIKDDSIKNSVSDISPSYQTTDLRYDRQKQENLGSEGPNLGDDSSDKQPFKSKALQNASKILKEEYSPNVLQRMKAKIEKHELDEYSDSALRGLESTHLHSKEYTESDSYSYLIDSKENERKE